VVLGFLLPNWYLYKMELRSRWRFAASLDRAMWPSAPIIRDDFLACTVGAALLIAYGTLAGYFDGSPLSLHHILT
jgi:hypothetical protein